MKPPYFFISMQEATEFIKKILAELPGSSECEHEFDVIYSVSVDRYYERSGFWADIGDIVLDDLRDLDAQQGAMYYEKGEDPYWDLADIDLDETQEAYISFLNSPDEFCIYAGEGVMIFHNENYQRFPVVVVKRSFWNKLPRQEIEKILAEDGSEYTYKVSPAVYIEVVKE